MGLLEWYFGFPPLVRFLISLVPLALSTVLWLAGSFWPWGWGIGAVLLCASFPTDGERNKWGDW